MYSHYDNLRIKYCNYYNYIVIILIQSLWIPLPVHTLASVPVHTLASIPVHTLASVPVHTLASVPVHTLASVSVHTLATNLLAIL